MSSSHPPSRKSPPGPILVTPDSRASGASELQLFDRPTGGEGALLVHIDTGDADDDLARAEIMALAESAGADIRDIISVARRRPDPRTFVGSGKVEELAALVASHEAALVIVNHALSPSQERNLERALSCQVIDRTGLILDIFAQRARTHEGKLQVELAQLRHVATRLVRGWTHLERQKGGIGMRGPGETQLETDRRLLGIRIKQLERRLARVRQQRAQGRQARRRRELPTVSLVGYTNAGKSTLFNRLTEAAVYADDRLFATLDTTLRRLELGNDEPVILADTVGFIRDLPHQLVAAFRSTLEEAAESDLLLHVVDAGDEGWRDSIAQVELVLEEIGALDLPRLLVFNKIDQTGAAAGRRTVEPDAREEVWVSAVTGDGLDGLLDAIRESVGADRLYGTVCLAPDEGRLRARLYELGAVVAERPQDDGQIAMELAVKRRDYQQLVKRDGLRADLLPAA